MKLNYRLKDNHLFFKIFSYFLFLLIPTVVIGILTYHLSIHVVRKNFDERISANLDSAINLVDTYIRTTQEIGISFFDDENVQNLMLPDDAQSANTKANLYKILRLIQKDENISGGFSDRIFAYADTKSVYVNGGINSYNSFFQNFYRYKEYDASFWEKRLTSDKSLEILPPSEVKQEDSRMAQNVVPAVMIKQMVDRNIVVVQNISVKSIANVLDGNSVFKSIAYVVTDGQGHVILDKNGFWKTLEDREKFQQISTEKSNGTEARLNGEDYITTFSVSGLCGWRYYALIPKSNYSCHASNILLMIVLMCVMLIVMGIIFSYIFSIKIYNPIRNIRDILTENAELPGKNCEKSRDEIQTIREGINELSICNARNETILNTYALKFIDNTILLLIEGKPVDTLSLLKMLDEHAGFHRKEYVCSIIQINFNSNFGKDFNQIEQSEILKEIHKLIRLCIGNGLSLLVIRTQTQFVCLANVNGEEEKQKLVGNLTRLIELFEYDVYYCNVKIGISKRFNRISDISSAFDEAMTAICSQKRFEIAESTDKPCSESFFYSTMDEQRILNCLSAADLEGIRVAVQNIWKKNIVQNVPYRQLNQLFLEMHFTGIRFLEERGVQQEQIRLKDHNGVLMGEFGSCTNFEQFKNCLLAFFKTVVEIAGSRRQSKPDGLPGIISEYIKENYMKNLSLDQIAEEMNLSVKYVSRVFKEKTGMNLTAYINQVRIEKAKELLVKSGMTVNEVSTHIGIDSRTTFLRIFKKVEGVTPNEYRIANRSKESLPDHYFRTTVL